MGWMGKDNELRPESVMVRNPGSETRDGGTISMRRRSFIVPPVVLVMRRKETEEAALVVVVVVVGGNTGNWMTVRCGLIFSFSLVFSYRMHKLKLLWHMQLLKLH